jgi:hypothetical protein
VLSTSVIALFPFAIFEQGLARAHGANSLFTQPIEGLSKTPPEAKPQRVFFAKTFREHWAILR